ncbi:MAG: hypothetical protein BGO49_03510 [Planctomycetales bacterium 71-10]|nr:MAG: hypothetical protein BGO49_03510 [Planctomycetales bacterium 71-10]
MNDLDRLWEATRPPSPSAEAWDRAWAGVAGRIDEPEPRTIAAPSRRRWAVAGLILLAQAAAVLLAVGASRFAAAPAAPVRIEEGQLVLIRGDGDAAQVADLSPRLGSEGVDAWYLVHNFFESAAGPFVAMAE